MTPSNSSLRVGHEIGDFHSCILAYVDLDEEIGEKATEKESKYNIHKVLGLTTLVQ
jgi:hypothetical protein